MQNDIELELLKYPIGRFSATDDYSGESIANAIQCIEDFPSLIDTETAHLEREQLLTPYRPGRLEHPAGREPLCGAPHEQPDSI